MVAGVSVAVVISEHWPIMATAIASRVPQGRLGIPMKVQRPLISDAFFFLNAERMVGKMPRSCCGVMPAWWQEKVRRDVRIRKKSSAVS